MKYGVFDTKDEVWIGAEDGPALWDEEDEALAAVSALIVDKQLDQPMGRTRAMPYSEDTTHIRDYVEPVKDALTALVELEEGV